MPRDRFPSPPDSVRTVLGQSRGPGQWLRTQERRSESAWAGWSGHGRGPAAPLRPVGVGHPPPPRLWPVGGEHPPPPRPGRRRNPGLTALRGHDRDRRAVPTGRRSWGLTRIGLAVLGLVWLKDDRATDRQGQRCGFARIDARGAPPYAVGYSPKERRVMRSALVAIALLPMAARAQAVRDSTISVSATKTTRVT